MHTHAIHDQLLLKNVRVEVVYEENPVSADEELSAIIRFRHYGIPKHTTPSDENMNGSVGVPISPAPNANGSHNGNAEPNGHCNGESREEDGAWFGRRLSLQLTNATRALFAEELEDNKPDWRNQPVNLLMGYAQLSGVMTSDPEVIDHTKIDEIRKKAAVSGKIGGLDGLEVSKDSNQGILTRWGWGLGGMMNTDVNELHLDEKKKSGINTNNVVPFFSTPKSLLFSDIKLQDGDTPVFYLKCRLPKGLPPSYAGKGVKIQYHLIVGVSLDEQIPKPINLVFPLNVSAHFDSSGYQPVSSLDKFFLLSPSNMINDRIPSKHGSNVSARRTSFRTIKNTALTRPKLSQSTKKDKFLDKLKAMSSDDTTEGPNIEDFRTTKVRDNVSLYTEALINKGELSEDEPKVITSEGYTFEKQVTKLQSQYVISRNRKSITTASFSKPIYKVGECIKLSLDFKNKDIQSTGCLVSLESLELIRDTYSINNQALKNSPTSVVHFKQSFQTYAHDSLPVSIPIPLSATAQFKTNIFECRWCLNLKFILTEDTLQTTIHEDQAGKLISAKESLAGYEFNCKLPVTVLPSDKVFGGITV